MYTLWLFNIAVENGLFIDDFPLNTYIYKGFSMATGMLNNQMVAYMNDVAAKIEFYHCHRLMNREKHPSHSRFVLVNPLLLGWSNWSNLKLCSFL